MKNRIINLIKIGFIIFIFYYLFKNNHININSLLSFKENKLLGVRETHRLVITIEPEKWRMGQVIKKL